MNGIEFIRLGLAVTALGLLAVCGSTPNTVTLPDGTVAYRIDCGGTASGPNCCFEKAGKSCGAEDYTIVTKEGRRISSSNAATSTSSVVSWETDNNSILITCVT